ncbi:MAG TPA: type II toxin-antitoxin system MqsA family antitoxin [Telluria sp.]|nr:type II toxin-antitoxin system MqsA family antitoxin [Telluria sp.]
MVKRDIFSELMEGFDLLEAQRIGKITLKQTTVEYKPAPEMTAAQVRQVREKLNVSQPVFARQLRIEARTVSNWEQGISKPNAQAVILLKLVDLHPELIHDIAAL